MPELPEVELFKTYFESNALHKKIAKIDIKSTQILEGITSTELQKKLTEKEFTSCKRHGKYLFTDVNKEFWLVMHFGMTGNLKYFKSMQDEPTHDRLLISFDNGYHLAFDNQRKFGRITITPNIQNFIEKKKLGPDALAIEFEAFKQIAAKSKGQAKYTLMNQHAIAGIGNIYSDEILFQTNVHPQTKINKLKEDTLKLMYNNMQRILKTAIENQADLQKLPKNYLLPNRSKGKKCPQGSGKIETIKITGRTAYFCPTHQKRIE